MSTTLQNSGGAVKERKSGEPVLTAADQTRFSWARLIQARDEVPPAYRGFFEARPADEAFPHAVLTPTFAGFMRRETEKLVCCLDDRLFILEKTSGEPKCTAFPLPDLNYVEVGGVLLKAWLKLQGRADNQTNLTTVTLRYNAVTDRLFVPFIERIRGANALPGDVPCDDELSKLDDVLSLSYKFRNFARGSLLPGDRVIAFLTQPEMRRLVIRFGRWSYRRTIAMAHVLILTDRELIIIRDDPDSPEAFDATRYGGVRDYIPLNKITGVVFQAKNATVLSMTLELPLGDRVESLFAAERGKEVEWFLNQLIEWAPEATLRRA